MRTIKKKAFTVLSSFFAKKKTKKIVETAINDGSVKKPRLGTIAKNNAHRRTSFIGIVFIIVAYLVLFFWMRNRFLFTPDFGESDAYHFNFSLKYFLSENLKNNSLPFWTDALSGGYPLFSESQFGALFLPNILFLKFLPFVDGYTLLFIFAFICITAGFFILLREYEFGLVESLLISTMFTFNGSLSLRWVHLTLVQSFSLIPLCFWVTMKYLREKKFRYLLALTFLVSQMFFAGHVQIIFIGILGLLFWIFLLGISEKKNVGRVLLELGFISFALIIGILIAAPQVLPTALLSRNSSRPFELDYQLATSFPLTWSHLRSFFDPFPFGNPKNGTYPIYSQNWGIFWENTSYLGRFFFPLFLAAICILRKKIFQKKTFIYIILFSIFTLLALGKNSPIYFVFNFFPFNLFRTPSKYLMMGAFFVFFGLSLVLQDVFRKVQNRLIYALFLVLMIVNVFELVRFAFTYHLFVPSDKLFSHPELTRFIPDDQYFFLLDPYTSWNNVFLKKGWSGNNEVESYLFMRNFLYPNSNLIVNKKVYAVNTGAFHLRRSEYMEQLIERLVQKEKKVIAPYIQNLMEIIGINTIISGYPLKGDMLQQKAALTHGDTTLYIYELDHPKSDWYYIPQKVDRIEFIDDFERRITDGNMRAANAVAEGIEKKQSNNTYTINNTRRSNRYYEFLGDFKEDTFVALKINYYPEWTVLIDGKKAVIYKTNLTHMGIVVPAGNHKVIIRYENSYFKIGLVLSFFAATGYIFFLVKSKRL